MYGIESFCWRAPGPWIEYAPGFWSAGTLDPRLPCPLEPDALTVAEAGLDCGRHAGDGFLAGCNDDDVELPPAFVESELPILLNSVPPTKHAEDLRYSVLFLVLSLSLSLTPSLFVVVIDRLVDCVRRSFFALRTVCTTLLVRAEPLAPPTRVPTGLPYLSRIHSRLRCVLRPPPPPSSSLSFFSLSPPACVTKF